MTLHRRSVLLSRSAAAAVVAAWLAALTSATIAADVSPWDDDLQSAARLVGARASNDGGRTLRAGVEIKLKPGWMIKHDVLLAEALLDAIVFGVVAVEVLDPKIQRVRRHAVDHALHLAGAAAPLPADLPIRKGGTDCPWRPGFVGVVQVVDRVGSIEEHRLLDHTLPDNLGEEVDVFLRAADAGRQVVETADQLIHGGYLLW